MHVLIAVQRKMVGGGALPVSVLLVLLAFQFASSGVLATSAASPSPLGSIKSDNGSILITTTSPGVVMINEVDVLAAIAALQDLVATLNATVVSQGALIQAQAGTILVMQATEEAQAANIAALSSQIGTLSASTTATFNNVYASATAQNASISSLQTAAANAVTNITTLFSKVSTVNTTQIAQGTAISNLQSTVTNNGANITTLFSTASTLNGGLTTANANLLTVNNSLQGVVSTHTANIATLNTNLASVNSSLQADINYPVIPPLGTVVCGASNPGAIRLNGSTLVLCAGGSWIYVNPNIGSSAGYPATSCQQIVSIQGGTVNGVYWITQTGGAIIQQVCSGTTNLGAIHQLDPPVRLLDY